MAQLEKILLLTITSALFIFIINSNCIAQSKSSIDSAKKIFLHTNIENEHYLSTCFFIADKFMDAEQYDSSQIWLNKIHEKLPVKGSTLNNYLLTTRQAEVYYYNNLQQLGLQESQRGLAIAKTLKDSFLLADSYNFLGLFLVNVDSVSKAIANFKYGISYIKQHPYPKQYISLTKPHHLYGNIAEAYFKLKQYDSALHYYAVSRDKANEIDLKRGVAVAYFGMAEVFSAQLKFDSADHFYQIAKATSIKSKDKDVALICYGGIAKSYAQRNQKNNANEALHIGLLILKENANLNRFYASNFLNSAYKVNKLFKNNVAIIEILELKSKIEKENIVGQNTQMQTILNAGLVNEKKVFNLQVEEAQRKQQLANTRLLMALFGFAFLGVTFLVYRYFQKQKHQVQKIRNDISRDLHDDIGASLSSLQIYGAVAEQSLKNNPEKALEMLQKIASQSKQVMENMNDIVWSMSLHNNNSLSLEAKVKDYSVELLSNNNIELDCSIDKTMEQLLKNMTSKRNVLLIIREALNNIAKYSKATKANLNIEVQNMHIMLLVKDNGIGFDVEKCTFGNGISNMKKRVKELNGRLELSSSLQNGTSITITIPIGSL